MPGDIHQILKQYWGYDHFRPLQEEVIRTVLEGNDALALMPTGGGKSLCYQLPALATEGLCLVVSPLIALMKDQLENLRKKNITACAIYSGMSRKEVINTLRIASESNCRFLYVSPERLESKLFLEYLPGLPITLIAVDEAHCVSQWGYDFRPPYLRIAALRNELPGIPVLALTASATPEVAEDIGQKLQLRSKHIFRQSFERPNLSYSCFQPPSRINKIKEILTNVPGTAIVYCRSRKRTREISDQLLALGIPADHYHAGLTQEQRNQRQSDWLNDKTRVIVCTNAFGMGIDKPDVRLVIHADAPECLENYYQEAGRAGRDGKKAYAVLLYENQDLDDLQEMALKKFPSLEEIRKVYQAICNYFQLPSGSAQGDYFDFDLSDLVKKFKLDSWKVVYSLKALEQDGWLAFNEQVFLPSTVQFSIEKNALYQFEKDHSDCEPLIKTLLRSYEGIYDRATGISENQLAGWLKKQTEEIRSLLNRLHSFGVIQYTPQKDKPQVLFLRQRVPVDHLKIDMRGYEERKKVTLERTKQMIAYIRENHQCRSLIIGRYFGDKAIKPCGICDNCRRKKNDTISREEFDALLHRILNMVKYEALEPAFLFSKMVDVDQEKSWKILEFLQKENKIEFDELGRVRLK